MANKRSPQASRPSPFCRLSGMTSSANEKSLEGLFQTFLATLFPPCCPACGTLASMLLPEFSRLSSEPPSIFCDPCGQRTVPVVPPFCSQCGLPFASREGDGHRCSECLQEKRYFRKARAYGLYGGSLLEAIHRFKYGSRLSLARPLAALARYTFFQCWDIDAVDLLIPVPLHVTRLRKRGFNQAFLLMNKWAKHEGLYCDGTTLYRRRPTTPQTGLSRQERVRNIRNAFGVRRPDIIRRQRILLIDDVYTTGATVNACAQALLNAGATSVDVLTLARAV